MAGSLGTVTVTYKKSEDLHLAVLRQLMAHVKEMAETDIPTLEEPVWTALARFEDTLVNYAARTFPHEKLDRIYTEGV